MMWGMIAVLGIYLSANVYLFIRLWQAIAPLPLWCRVLYATLFWLAAAAMFIAIGARNIPACEALNRTLFNVGSVWMVFLLYMVLTTVLTDVAHLVFPEFKHGVWYALGITAALLVYGNYNYHHPRITSLNITTSKPIEHDLRIAALSDVHLGYGTDKEMLRRYVELINREHPDIVVIVGDLIDNSTYSVVEAHMEEELRQIEAPLGIYMVAGNHEYISDIGACEEFIAKTPITLLRDSIKHVTDGISIIGRDDRINRQRKPLVELMQEADPATFTVVLDHQPNSIVESCEAGIDLHLSGHTHRGQVWPISWLTDALFEQSHGHRRWDRTDAYVMQGLSLWGPPFRIGTESELLIVNIKAGKE